MRRAGLGHVCRDGRWTFYTAKTDCLVACCHRPSFEQFDRAWPWPRRRHAELIRRLSAAGARLIIYDVLFADKSNDEDDQALAEALGQTKNVILAEVFEGGEYKSYSTQTLVQPLEMLRKAAWEASALSAVTPDADGVVRRFHLSLGGRPTIPALAYQILKSKPPRDEDSSGLINFLGPPGCIDTVSFYQVLD